MGRMRKGMFFMLSVVLLSTAFLYLISSLSMYSNSLRTTAATLSEMERLNSYSQDLACQIKSILVSEAVDVKVFAADDMKVISLEETIPRTPDYYADLLYFKEFAESRGQLDTSINISEASRPKLFARPYNITIDHDVGRIMVVPENNPGSSGSIIAYNLLVSTDGPTPIINWTNVSEVSAYHPDAVLFHFGLQGSNGTISIDKYLDKYGPTEFHLLDYRNDSIFVVQLDSPASLTVNHNIEGTVKTEIYLNDSEEDTSIELGSRIISVNLGKLGDASKISGVSINEG